MPSSVGSIYTDGSYKGRHADWHLADAPGKAQDIQALAIGLANSINAPTLRIADVGAGVGGVLANLLTLLQSACPQITCVPTAFEPSSDAAKRAESLFPKIPVICRSLTTEDGPFDVVLLVDVLEHLENPRELLRIARQVATHVLVRQPLLENFSTFRHKNYRSERLHWGHIAYFNYYSFLDLMEECGWHATSLRLTPPWELAGTQSRVPFWKRQLARQAPILSSYLMAPFYLLGTFCVESKTLPTSNSL